MRPEIVPLFPTPLYLCNAKYYTNDVINLDNINYDEFYDNGLESSGKVLVSNDQNILTNKKYSVIKKYCDDAICDYTYNILGVSSKIKPILTCSWMLIGYPGAVTGNHLHQNSVFSGIFYIKSSETSGDLVLSQPSFIPTSFSTTIRPEIENHNIFNSKNFVYTPKDNDIVIFPSHVYHEVTKNNSEELRCAIAFNYFLEGNICQDNTENLSLNVGNYAK